MKSFTAILIGCLVVFNTPLVEALQPTMTQQLTMTQQVPENTSHALMFSNVTELKERGNEFTEEMGFKGKVSMLFRIVRGQRMLKG